MALTDFGFSGAPQPTQQSQQPSGDILSSFGATPGAAGGNQNPLPAGLQLGQLDPQTRLDFLDQNAEYFQNLWGATTYRQRVKSAEDQLKAQGEPIRENINEGLRQVGVRPGMQEGDLVEEIDEFRGRGDDLFFGTGPDDSGFLGIRNITRWIGLDQDSTNRSAGLQQIASDEMMAAREQLQGQGQVSNYEAQIAGTAQTTIGTEGTSPEEIDRRLFQLRDFQKAADFRNQRNIRFDSRGREWRWDIDPETGQLSPTRVVTYMDQNGAMQQMELSDPSTNVISVTFSDVPEDMFKAEYYNDADSGTIFLYDGTYFEKGAENDPYR